MSILTGTNLSMSFGVQDVFERVNVSIAHGDKIALVGPNGEGKTTLVQILIGAQAPTTGQVTRMKGIQIGYLPQQADLSGSETPWEMCCAVYSQVREMQARLRELEALLADPAHVEDALERYGRLQAAFEHAGGYAYEVEIRTVLNGLGLDEAHMHRAMDALSGGQRTRALLAKLLLVKPDILVLDEPTNHLDLQAIEWLESYLLEWPEAVLVVSHDRRFMDKVVTKVWDLSMGTLSVYRGNYTHYVAQRAERQARRMTEWEDQQEEIARTEDFIRRNMAGQRTRQAQGREKRLQRVERLERPPEERTIRLRLESDQRSGDLVLRTRDLVVGYDRPLLEIGDLELRRLHRAALIGPNGSGKTTFLKVLLGQLAPLRGEARLGASLRIGYWAQSREDLDPENTIIDEILQVEDMPIPQVRNLMARFLFTEEDPYKRIGDLSGGEQCRVALAKLTLAEPNFLILDEPTNQLDVASQEVIEDVLGAFIGTILFVTHDRYLIDALATQVWAIRDGRLYVYEGNYQEYLARRQVELAALREAAERERQAERQRRQAEEALRRARAAEDPAHGLVQIEGAIAETERTLRGLEHDMAEASATGAFDRLRALDVEYKAVQADLEGLIAEWAALGEALE
ncbi:MAG: ABC-F family ATP-binding cassette domain-containing protein [Anaerolineae bacterium]|nr:ABC-F family ATP-binding cassette domain-containing protein [Anaerolineae bacterium]